MLRDRLVEARIRLEREAERQGIAQQPYEALRLRGMSEGIAMAIAWLDGINVDEVTDALPSDLRDWNYSATEDQPALVQIVADVLSTLR